MNRRDFHRTLIAGAGMAALPAWANLLPTPEDMLCGHELRPGVRCMRQGGHEWEHRAYQQFDNGNVTIPEWNDDRVVWKQMDRAGSIRWRPDHSMEELEIVAEWLIQEAEQNLNAGAVFELRTHSLPVDLETFDKWGMAWYWQPAPHEIPRGFNPAGRTLVQSGFFRVPPLEGFPRSGYNVFARLRA